ncbi:hypothetical protein [Rhodococcus sp. KRD162]|nr:hypothetical protein [Rhodococcus sp. KRD162]
MLHVKGEQWRSELEEYRPAEIRSQVRDGAEVIDATGQLGLADRVCV